MRTLPKNICAHPDGWLVRVQRGGVLYQAFVSFGSSREISLARAVALRDQFLKLANSVLGVRAKGHSSTGIVGISETCTWRHQHCYPCFAVNWREAGRQKLRRFTYGIKCTRDQARAQAIEWRARVTGLPLPINHQLREAELRPTIN